MSNVGESGAGRGSRDAEVIGQTMSNIKEAFAHKLIDKAPAIITDRPKPTPIKTIELKLSRGDYTNDPIAFGHDVLRLRPTWQQRMVLVDDDGFTYLDYKNNSIKSGHSIGKTKLIAWTGLHFICTRPDCIVIITSSNALKQIQVTTWKEVAASYSESPFLKKHFETPTGEMLRSKENPKTHFMALRTAKIESGSSHAVALQGLHSGPHTGGMLIIGDESSAMSKQAASALVGAITQEENYMLLMGNPTHLSGFFYDTFHKLKDYFRCMTFDSRNSPLVTDLWLQIQKDMWGEHSDEFRVKVKGLFPRSEEYGLVPTEYVERALVYTSGSDEDVDRARELVEDRRNWEKQGAMDVALSGKCKTVLMARYKEDPGTVCAKEVCPETKDENIARWALERCEALNITSIVIENTGPGEGVVSHMRKFMREDEAFMHLAGQISIVPVNTGEKPKLKYFQAQFINKRAQAYWSLRRKFEQEIIRIVYGPDQNLLDQLPSIRVQKNARNKIQIESKQQMDNRGMASPDDSDALMLLEIFNISDMVQKISDRFAEGSRVKAQRAISRLSAGTRPVDRSGGKKAGNLSGRISSVSAMSGGVISASRREHRGIGSRLSSLRRSSGVEKSGVLGRGKKVS